MDTSCVVLSPIPKSGGPARQRAHTAMKRMLAGELRRLHFETDVERVVPELSSPESDAIMDLVTFSPDNFSRFLGATWRGGLVRRQ